MRAHHLLILVVTAVVAILATLWTGSLREPEHPAGAGTWLVPGLEAKLNEIAAVEVKGKDGATVTLERGTDTWIIREKSGYPADTGKVRKLLIGLAQAKLLEQKTANAEHYGELGVADLDAAPASADAGAKDGAKKPETAGALVSVQVPVDGKERVELIIGNTARGATGTYVRKVGDPQSWLASGDLAVAADPLSWLDRQILDVPASRVQQVSIRHPDGQTLVLGKETRADPNYTVHDVPAKREVKYASIGNPIASALASLRLDDLAMLVERDPAAHAPIEGEYRTFDGLVVTVQTYVEDDKHYAHFAARFDEDQARRFYVAPPASEPAAPAAEAAGAAETASDAGPAATSTSDAATPPAPATEAPGAMAPSEAAAEPAAPDFSAVRTEAEGIDKKVQPWVFMIGSYKYDQMNKHVADMLKEQDGKAP